MALIAPSDRLGGLEKANGHVHLRWPMEAWNLDYA
jgi:hypothetical protein